MKDFSGDNTPTIEEDHSVAEEEIVENVTPVENQQTPVTQLRRSSRNRKAVERWSPSMN